APRNGPSVSPRNTSEKTRWARSVRGPCADPSNSVIKNRRKPVALRAQAHIQRIEKMFAATTVIETSDAVKLRAAQRAVEKLAPFHRGKNSMGDAILVEI